jgi:hypothetical protein
VICSIFDLFSFKERALATRFALAIPVSIALCPAIAYLLSRIAPAAAWLFFAACSLLFPVLIVLRPAPNALRSKYLSAYLGVAAFWTVLAIFTLIDLQLDSRLYFPTVTHDYAVRSAFTSAISRSFPPNNPWFFPGRFFPLRYHYFWFILCSLVQRLGGDSLSSRQAMIAGTVWCGLGLLAIVPIWLRFFRPPEGVALNRRALIAIALLGVTGFDILPVLLTEFINKSFLGSIEWWNDPVSSWISDVFWVPHHVAALIACLTAFLIIQYASRLNSRRGFIVSALLGGVIFAGALGTSIYVTFVFALCLAVWAVVAYARGQHLHAALIVTSGCAALLFSIPYLLELFVTSPAAASTAGHPAQSAFPLAFAVKPLNIVDGTLGLSTGPAWRANLINLLLLPLNYLLELGFFLVAGVVHCRRLWRDRARISDSELCAFTLAAVSFLCCTFVRSSVIANNDLGWRGIMIAQFFLLLWGAELLSNGLPKPRVLIAAALILGFAGSAYELVKIRFFTVLADATPAARQYNWLVSDGKLGYRTFALRSFYEELRRRTPQDVVLQHNPNVNLQDNFHGLYADRQLAAETLGCGVVFGGDPELCRTRIGAIEALFDDTTDSDAVDNACHNLSIDILVVQDSDKVWQNRASWVWTRSPLVANTFARAFACSPATKRSAGS